MSRPPRDVPAADPALAAVGGCLDAVGTTGFNHRFIGLATGPLAADQCMIFAYRPGAARCFLSYNAGAAGAEQALVERYLREGHQADPVRARLEAMADGALEILPGATLHPQMSPGYRHAFFARPGLVDKLAVLVRRGDLKLCVNLYRRDSSGPYPADPSGARAELLRIAARLALLHYGSSTDHSLEDPLLTLSDRERQTCRLILRGMTTDAIAHALAVSPHTVTTFRKRAYEKLAINSKAALFTLCG